MGRVYIASNTNMRPEDVPLQFYKDENNKIGMFCNGIDTGTIGDLDVKNAMIYAVGEHLALVMVTNNNISGNQKVLRNIVIMKYDYNGTIVGGFTTNTEDSTLYLLLAGHSDTRSAEEEIFLSNFNPQPYAFKLD